MKQFPNTLIRKAPQFAWSATAIWIRTNGLRARPTRATAADRVLRARLTCLDSTRQTRASRFIFLQSQVGSPLELGASCSPVAQQLKILGSTFAINYRVDRRPTTPCRFLFFKLFMNSRRIASWGLDLETQSMGCVAKSLWAPSEKYGDQVGIESRNFLFLPDQEQKSIAENGGIIEIRVFRAKEKSARSPRLDEFCQDSFGIA